MDQYLVIIHGLGFRLLYVVPQHFWSNPMLATQNQKRATLFVKPHPNNMGAQLLCLLPTPRLARKVVTLIGWVRFDTDLRTGIDIVMKKPYTLADLTSADRKKIAAWLADVKSAAPRQRRALTTTDVKPL